MWNVNGLRSIAKKNVKGNINFKDYISKYDIVVLNETRTPTDELANDNLPEGFFVYHTHSNKKLGYSGVSILTKVKPISKIQEPSFSIDEGRIVALEYDKFILVGTYVPNGGSRMKFRVEEWDGKFRKWIVKIKNKFNKRLIVCGDMNVANNDNDVHNATKVYNHAGFTIEERDNFKLLLKEASLIDIWRVQYPQKKQFTYFDYRTHARKRNAGWRIDYLLDTSMKSSVEIEDLVGSDHLPLRCKIDGL